MQPGESTRDVGFCATRTANTGSYPIRVRARRTSGQERINLTVGGTVVATWTLSTSLQDYSVNTNLGGGINVVFTNDAANRDVVLDYVAINNVVNQAEAQTQKHRDLWQWCVWSRWAFRMDALQWLHWV